jgi:hypothetical protein
MRTPNLKLSSSNHVIVQDVKTTLEEIQNGSP